MENSIYHGIKPNRKNGNIFISTSLKEDYVELVVSDNGVGIDEERLQSIIEGGTPGIGLRGTMERLSIFYNGKGKFEVKSKIDEGTQVIIHIPIEQEESYE